ncbi:MAG: hypothetical protein P1U36_04420 [Legionellaceae bacterium]|nr:hypothetical protein [Legionellaceae bacterium]
MKKLIVLAGVLAAGPAVSGTMGDVHQPSMVPYLTADASWTSPSIGAFVLNGNTAVQKKQGWGGRLGAGIFHAYSERLGFVSEIGGGYYGGVKFGGAGGTASTQGNSRTKIDGYEALVGAIYNVEQLEHFKILGQIGFMLQNYRKNVDLNYTGSIPDSAVQGLTHISESQTAAQPEFKVGGIYSVNNNWDLAVTYLHTFGGTRSGKGTIVASPTGQVNINTSLYNQNPTLNAVLFGLRYNIV